MPVWAAIMACLTYPLLSEPFQEKPAWRHKGGEEDLAFTNNKTTKNSYYCSDFFIKHPMDLLTNPRVIKRNSDHKNELFIPLTFYKPRKMVKKNITTQNKSSVEIFIEK